MSYRGLRCGSHLLIILPDQHNNIDVMIPYDVLWDIQTV